MRRQVVNQLALRQARTAHVAAPVGGWNTRDALARMAPLDAVQMQNVYSDGGEVRLRGGCTAWVTGMTGTVNSLWSYGSAAGLNQLFASTSFGIYDVTNTGVAGAPVVAWGIASTQWNAVNFNNSAGTSYLWGVDGANAAQMWDGAAWAVPVITGLATTSMVCPWIHGRRIWVIEKNSMSAWYLNIDSIQGPAKEFPIGALFSRGGRLVAGGSWSVDGGAGSNDYWAVITSEGECAVYAGNNPDSATSWSLIGVFDIGRPLHQRCFRKFGGDLLVLTESGLYPLSKALPTAQVNATQALTDKIRPTFQSAAQRSLEQLTTIGWECQLLPIKNALLVSYPTETDNLAQYRQFVLNTVTKSWHQFTGWNSRCMAVHNGELFFGYGTGTVAKAWSTGMVSDFGNDIVGTVQTAFSYFGKLVYAKQITLFRPLLTYDERTQVAYGLTTDYAPPKVTTTLPRSSTAVNNPVWDVATWDVSPWDVDFTRRKLWQNGANAPAYAISLLLQLTSKNANVAWVGTDYIVDDGGVG